MSKAVKASLMSAFVLPGSGHLYLKQYPKAIAFFAVSGFAIFKILAVVHTVTQRVMAQVIEQGTQPNFLAINNMVHNSPELQNMSTYFYAFLIIWAAALIDAYRQGKKQELQGSPAEAENK